MFRLRWIILAIAVIMGLGFPIGILHINTDVTKCVEGKSWSFQEWHTLLAVGRYELRYPTINYDCNSAGKYDPRYEQVGPGVINAPVDTTTKP